MSSRHSYKSLGTNPDQSRGRTCRRRPCRCVSEFLRTVRSNPADRPPLAHPNHQKHRRKLFSSPLNGGRSALHPQMVRSSFPNPTQKQSISGAQSTFVRRTVRGIVPDGPQYIFGHLHRTKPFLEPVSNFTGGRSGPQGRTVRCYCSTAQ